MLVIRCVCAELALAIFLSDDERMLLGRGLIKRGGGPVPWE